MPSGEDAVHTAVPNSRGTHVLRRRADGAKTGLWVIASVSCYARLSEKHLLQTGNEVQPVFGGPSALSGWTLVLRPFEQEARAKTLQFDEALCVDNAGALWQKPALRKLARRKRLSQASSRRADRRSAALVIQPSQPPSLLKEYTR